MTDNSAARFLALDVGNTHVTIGLMCGQQTLREWRLATRRDATADEWQTLLRFLPGFDEVSAKDWVGAAICSVVPPVDAELRAAVSSLIGRDTMLLSPEMPLGLTNAYNPPGDVGMDRLANAVAAVESYGAPLVIVDFGTATTLDVVDGERRYLGGVILAGLQTTAEALHQRAAKLPLVRLEAPRGAIGRSTVEAMRAGLFHGCIDAVDGGIRRIEAELGVRVRVIATGGIARVLGPAMTRVDALDDTLTLRGIERLWRLNGGAPS